MGQHLPTPFPQFCDSAGLPYSGGILRFYESGGSTPLAVYSDRALSSSLGTSITLDSAGRPSTLLFLKPQLYKVTLETSLGVVIWTADPVSASDFLIYPKWTPGSGSPSGVVAGTAGSSGILPDAYWDYTNLILYICTTTGSAAAAVWTAVNASAATPAVPPPQGRLTLTSDVPVLAADVISGPAVYYTPYIGNLVPIYNGATMTPTEFSELTLTLAAQHAISTLYDVFVFSNSGVLTLVTGPAWTTSTAGSGARGTGAGTSALARVKGLYTNAVQITGRNGASTYTIAANLATYLGSLFIDGVAGQITCHRSYGQSRKFGVWNAYNRRPIILKAGDSTASWTYTTGSFRSSNNAAANSLSLFSGLPEEYYDLNFMQLVACPNGSTTQKVGIGYNSVTVASGLNGNAVNGGGQVRGGDIVMARYFAPPALGVQTISALEYGATTTTFSGTEANMILSARWDG